MEQFLFFSVIVLWGLFLLNFFLLFLLFRQFGEIYLSSGDGIAKDGLPIGKSLPKDDRIYSMKEKQHVYLQEHITKSSLLVFVSSNCKPCQQLLREWNSAYHSNQHMINCMIVFIGEDNKVQDLIRKYSPEGQLFWDRNDSLFHRFKIRVTPFAIAIDEQGIVRDKGLCGTKEQINMYAQSILKDG
ncbi:thioredoxin-like domain-containing protein [Evansella sp. AB-rgal1]|uniref:thioredoxin-like domain-containing protein n=1 Tax=Evansella sp. AB-rgal1 TaxID=3242696 RepID=UPI00359E043B